MKIRSVGAELFIADGQTDVRDESNGYFTQFSQHTQNTNRFTPSTQSPPQIYSVPQYSYSTIQ